jgi:nucleotide-binding universal stress UspA family protein
MAANASHASSEGDPDLVHRCNGTIHRLIKRTGNKYLCCVDGSDASDLAFKVLKALLKPSDTILMFHAYRKKRTGDLEFDPNDIRRKYTQHLTSSVRPPSRFEFEWVERKNNETVLEALQKHLGTYEFSWEALRPKAPPDFIILGQNGRKGPKSNPTALGTNSDLALRSVHAPCIIAKKYIPSGARKFILFVNGSLSSRIGFEILVQLICSRDTFTVVHVANKSEEEETKEDDAHVAEMREYFEEELDKYGPRYCSFVATHIKHGQAVNERMVEYVNASGCDIMALAPRAKDFLSSTSEYVISHVNCCVILCKN